MKLLPICLLIASAFAEPPVNSYLPPQNGLTAPSSSYGPPGSGHRQTQALFGRPSSNSFGRRPSSTYGAPSHQQSSRTYIPPNQPSTQYGTPDQGIDRTQYAPPSQQYGVPGFGNNGGYSDHGRQGYDDGSNGEPANYNFEYMVKDDQYGTDFGHRESRQGDVANGIYYVLLPDGRKQTVEYVADRSGYKPKISYEDTGLGANGYNRNAQPGYDQQGYHY